MPTHTMQCVDRKVTNAAGKVTSNTSEMILSKKQAAAIILEKVQSEIKQGATLGNLFNILILSTPKLTIDNVINERERLRAMEKLMIQIHPRNFPDNEDAPSIYEDVQVFLETCSKTISKIDRLSLTRKRNRNNVSPTTVVESVVQFNVRQKWNFLDDYTRPVTPLSLTSGKLLAPLIAYQCINARGAIAHGKKPSLIYSWENASACNGLSVQKVFDNHGGFRTISSLVEDIKVEIIHNGTLI